MKNIAKTRGQHQVLTLIAIHLFVLLTNYWLDFVPTKVAVTACLLMFSLQFFVIRRMKQQCPECKEILAAHKFKIKAIKLKGSTAECPKCQQVVCPIPYLTKEQLKKTIKRNFIFASSLIFLILAFPPIVLMPLGFAVLYVSPASEQMKESIAGVNKFYDKTQKEGTRRIIKGEIPQNVDTSAFVNIRALELNTLNEKENLTLVINLNSHSIEQLESKLSTQGLKTKCSSLDQGPKEQKKTKTFCFPLSYMKNPKKFKQSNSLSGITKTMFFKTLKVSFLYSGFQALKAAL